MLTRDGRVKLADFGIARIDDISHTQTGAVLGTPAYMSPEQIQGNPVGPPSDIYSTGIVLYEILTNDRPFSGAPTTVMQKILNVMPARPSLINTEIPGWLDEVLEKALAKRPADRYRSAREFAAALRPPAKAAAPPRSRFTEPPPPPAVPGTGGRRRVWAAAALGILLAAGAVGWGYLGDGALPFGAGDGPAVDAEAARLADRRIWEVAERAGTPEALRGYLQAHPDGAYAGEARRRLAGPTPDPSAAAGDASAEPRAWDEASRLGTEAAFAAYLQAFPEGPNAAAAGRRIAQIRAAAAAAEAARQADAERRAEAARLADRRAWEDAERIGTEAAYRGYLQTRPDGRHVAEATRRIAERQPGGPAPAAAPTGIWTGSYACSRGPVGATLEVSQAEGGPVEAVLNFGPTPHTPGVVPGNLRLTGRYDAADRRLILGAAGRAGQPADPAAPGLDGRIDAAGAYRGEMIRLPGCAAFEFRRGAAGDPGTAVAGAPGPTPGQVFRDCAECPELVAIPAGRFTMGSPAAEAGRLSGEGPQRTVTFAQPFALGRTAVTLGEFRAFVAATGHAVPPGCDTLGRGGGRRTDPARTWTNPGFDQTDRHPVVCVSWDDAQAYLRWLSGRTGQTYRLPTEAEWEYAARAGTAGARYWGDDPVLACRHANTADLMFLQAYKGRPGVACRDGHVRTAPVGSYPPNPFGLHDMLGNVWEWTEDCATRDYQGAPGDGSAVTLADCRNRTGRGGAWNVPAEGVRAALRGYAAAGSRADETGFRVARGLTAR